MHVTQFVNCGNTARLARERDSICILQVNISEVIRALYKSNENECGKKLAKEK